MPQPICPPTDTLAIGAVRKHYDMVPNCINNGLQDTSNIEGDDNNYQKKKKEKVTDRSTVIMGSEGVAPAFMLAAAVLSECAHLW